ncbi:hypothetical protein [Clostridium gasigenes]|nr:hypothetical protein [Clostridium gasigenes]
MSSDKLAFNILKKNLLIKISINDKYFAGLIVVKGDLKIAVINTS